MFIGAATFTMGAYSTQEVIEFCSSKNDEGLPILRAFCGSAIITKCSAVTRKSSATYSDQLLDYLVSCKTIRSMVRSLHVRRCRV